MPPLGARALAACPKGSLTRRIAVAGPASGPRKVRKPTPASCLRCPTSHRGEGETILPVDGPREAEIAFRLRRADPVEIDVPSAMGADLVARLGGDERSTTSGANQQDLGPGRA